MVSTVAARRPTPAGGDARELRRGREWDRATRGTREPATARPGAANDAIASARQGVSVFSSGRGGGRCSGTGDRARRAQCTISTWGNRTSIRPTVRKLARDTRPRVTCRGARFPNFLSETTPAAPKIPRHRTILARPAAARPHDSDGSRHRRRRPQRCLRAAAAGVTVGHPNLSQGAALGGSVCSS